jgi:predicted regulator of Ras-like GTPase activity (Roadblock/LC7/MglB family)
MIVKKPKTDLEIVQQKLQTVKDQEGILGYIMRDSKSASVDLKDPTKIIDYAMLSSTAHEISQNMTESLQIGEVNIIVVESETTKLLSMNVNNHHVSLFMNKDDDHNKISINLA